MTTTSANSTADTSADTFDPFGGYDAEPSFQTSDGGGDGPANNDSFANFGPIDEGLTNAHTSFETGFDAAFDGAAFEFPASPGSAASDLSDGMLKGTAAAGFNSVDGATSNDGDDRMLKGTAAAGFNSVGGDTSNDGDDRMLKGTAAAGFNPVDGATSNDGDDHDQAVWSSSMTSPSSETSGFFSEKAAQNARVIPVNIALHEEMSCAYDNISRASSVSVEGTISVKSSVALEGNQFHLTLKDSQQHVDKLSFDASFVSEVYHTTFSGHEGSRIFGARLPDYGGLPDADIEMVKYTCSESLIPVPILVQSKVRLAGQFCRVAVKIRSNPSNQQKLHGVAVLLAVPPDFNGETVKMSRKGGVWDAMKRLIVWSFPSLKPGETLELQSQFEFASPKPVPAAKPPVPKFPVLVRFDSKDVQLSCVDVEVNGGGNAEFSFERFELNLTRSYRVLHRKL